MAQYLSTDPNAGAGGGYLSTDPGAGGRSVPKMNKLPTMTESLSGVIGEEASPLLAKIIGGAGTDMDSAALRLKQLFGNDLNAQDVSRETGNRQFIEAGGLPAIIGSIVGNLAMTGGPAMALARGVSSAAARILPRILAPTAGAVASGAAVSGATMPVLEGESTLGNMGAGALGGVLGDAGARGLSRAVQPILQSPPVQALLRHDVVPTVGQAAGKDSFLGRAEQRAQSVLGVGDIITGARQRVGKEFNRAAINQGVPDGLPPVPSIGKEGVNELRMVSDQNFSRLLEGKSVTPDAALFREVMKAPNNVSLPLSPDGLKRFQQIVNKSFIGRFPKGPIPAEKMKAEMIGDLGKAAQQFSRGTAEEKALGEALKNARDAAQQWMLKAAKVPAGEMAKADTAYTAKSAVEGAAKSAKGRGGEFTPLELMRKARRGSASERLAEAGQEVLPGVVPNSGSIDRAALAAALGIGGGAANEYYGGPSYLTALALAPLLYSRAGSRYMIGDLIPGQQLTAEAIRRMGPAASQIGRAYSQIQPPPRQ